MKKILIKTAVVSFLVLFLPFLLTLALSGKDHRTHSLEGMDFTIYYERNGEKEKLDLYKYLIGVVAANMPASYDMEALKAQSVVARTYALYNLSLLSEEYPNKKSFTTSEIGLSYISLSDMEQFWGKELYINYFSKIENAVYATSGEVLTYKDTLILPVFFSVGSGYTRNASEAWGINIPYLISVPSKHDVTSTNYLKIMEFDVSNIMNKLNQYFSNLTVNESNFFDEVRVEKRDSTNYVTKVNLGSLTVSGEEFAKVLGLNSCHFYIENYEGKVRIICTGVGHGVGLSQYGANAMASEGSSYKDILSHYFTSISIIQMKEN